MKAREKREKDEKKENEQRLCGGRLYSMIESLEEFDVFDDEDEEEEEESEEEREREREREKVCRTRRRWSLK